MEMQLELKRLYESFHGTLRPAKQWPYPESDLENEPHFLFVITPPRAGSTVLAKILNSAHNTTFLAPRGEGQWIVPGMCGQDRWMPEKHIDWQSVRAVWLHRIAFIRSLTQKANLIIEKSPPNLVRVDKLVNTFPNSSLIVFNRDPFANCSSTLYREYHSKIHDNKKRLEILKKLANQWLFRTQLLKKWVEEKDTIHFTYEDFCTDPEECIQTLINKLPELEGINTNIKLKVKDYKEQGITNQNKRQISNLTSQEIDAISEILSSDQKLINYFGYGCV